MRILGLDGSPAGTGRTAGVIRAVLDAAAGDAVEVSLESLAETSTESIVERITQADALVFGSPIYRASFAYPLKVLLDGMPRGMWGETSAPLRGKAVVVVATGASLHHFLALNDFRNVLAGFFAAHVVPPGLYVPREGFDANGALAPPYIEQARLQGQALVELTRVIQTSTFLRNLTPQA